MTDDFELPELTDEEIEMLIRAQWQREGIPTDTMDGGQRTVTIWERAAFRAGRDN